VEAALIADHDVARRLAAYVVQSACDLLVVGARHEPHHSPFESVAEKLVRKASCSVLVVRASTGGAP
ncbi:MAG: universal stress protein, partial [Myxococcales bacterium]